MLEDMRHEERRAWETTTDCNCGLQGGAARSNNRRNEPHFGCRTKILRASTWTAAVLAAAGRQVAATHCRENVIRIQTGNWRQKIRSEACRDPNTLRLEATQLEHTDDKQFTNHFSVVVSWHLSPLVPNFQPISDRIYLRTANRFISRAFVMVYRFKTLYTFFLGPSGGPCSFSSGADRGRHKRCL